MIDSTPTAPLEKTDRNFELELHDYTTNDEVALKAETSIYACCCCCCG